MTPDPRTDRVIEAWLDQGPTGLTAAERGAIADAAEVTGQRRWAFPTLLPERRAFVFAAATVVLALAAAALLPALRQNPIFGRPAPMETNTPAPSPVATTPPFVCQSEAPNVHVEWTGPVRTDLAGMPLLCRSSDQRRDAPDPRGDALAWADILNVSLPEQPNSWSFQLADFPPPFETLDPAETLIEYGFVVETTGDDVADYVVGINNDAPNPGEFRVWVTRLDTDTTQEQVGPPYGFPIDFSHPEEHLYQEPAMLFFFVGTPPWEIGYGPGHPSLASHIRSYAWTSVTNRGEVSTWDYAPDYGWLSDVRGY